jgi:polyhydroxyalkanoate synthesis regulator phasin
MVNAQGDRHPELSPCPGSTMESANPLQQLLLRGLGTTTLVADRLRYVTQEWVSSGRLDPSHASALVDDVLKALRGETPELEQQMGRNLERNRDNLLQDLGVASQKEMDELRGRIDRLEQQLRQRDRQD